MLSRPVLAAAGAVLAITGILLWLFGPQLDQPIAALLHLGRDYPNLRYVVLLTDLGGAAAMIPVGIAGALLLVARGHGKTALWLVVTVASGRLLVELIKAVVGRARPDAAGQLVHVGSTSFPSGHSAGAMLTVLALLLAFRAQRRVAVPVLAWPLLIGCTRVMLGVHWPSDVLAGWGVALLWTALLARWLPPSASGAARFKS